MFRNNGQGQKAEVTQRKLIKLQEKLKNETPKTTISTDITKIVQKLENDLKDLSFEDSIIALTQIIEFYKKDKIDEDLIEKANLNPLSSLFGIRKNNYLGQQIFELRPLNFSNLKEDRGLLDNHIFHRMTELQESVGFCILKYGFEFIKKNKRFSIEDVDFLVKDNPIIPNGRENIFRTAIFMAFNGEYYAAIHILGPQMEHLFRVIAETVDGITITLEKDGTSKQKVLSSVLNLPELKECYDNDIIFLFRGLLNEQTGANIRNEVAHGILDENRLNGAHLYFICATIKLISMTSLYYRRI